MSMGGFIAQTFAIENPTRTLSLTSIYSHCGNSQKYTPSQEVFDTMVVPAPEERKPYIEHMLNIFKITYGSGLPFDEEYHRKLAGQAFDRSFCPEGEGRQYLALILQKDRTTELAKLNVPSLIIHGNEDPLVPLAGGKATADAIPGSKFMIIKGMGHVMPNLNVYWDDIKNAMIDLMATT
jgi:pimeloyl-ACP methyl ester carboxylesterase